MSEWVKYSIGPTYLYRLGRHKKETNKNTKRKEINVQEMKEINQRISYDSQQILRAPMFICQFLKRSKINAPEAWFMWKQVEGERFKF